jgi:DNA polymerase-3 subunit epsilon
MLYAVVDIETTGGFASGNGITEIAIIVHDGSSVLDRYETLINPMQEIPSHIEALTGISNEMVQTAPTFDLVAAKIYDLLNDKIFVAHNVNFDFSFVRHQLGLAGYELQARKLCTVRMSRKIIPGHRSYSLGKLCNDLKIELNNRHRAGGDADATATLLTHLLTCDCEGHISTALNKFSKDHVLPPHLHKSEIEKLPSRTGVYYFKDQKGKVLYVGKAKDLKKRVCSHFSGNNISRQRQNFLKEIYNIDYEECGTELMAFILEASEIKKLWPPFNRALKSFTQKYGLYSFEDQKGYIRLGIDKYKKNTTALYSFDTILEGHNLLKLLIKEHLLCEKLCFVQTNRSVCTGHTEGKCAGACINKESSASYNVRVKYALNQLKSMLPSYAVIDNGRNDDEQSCLLVEKGIFYGMGYISNYTDVIEPELLKSALQPYQSNDYILHMISSYVERFPDKKISI